MLEFTSSRFDIHNTVLWHITRHEQSHALEKINNLSPSEVTKFDHILLQSACRHGLEEVVRSIFNILFSKNIKIEESILQSAFFLAAESGNINVLTQFQDRGLIRDPSIDNNKALVLAIKNNRRLAVEYLVFHSKVASSVANEKNKLLILACEIGNIDIIACLLAQRGVMKCIQEEGIYHAIYAANNAGHYHIALYLLDVDQNSESQKKLTIEEVLYILDKFKEKQGIPHLRPGGIVHLLPQVKGKEEEEEEKEENQLKKIVFDLRNHLGRAVSKEFLYAPPKSLHHFINGSLPDSNPAQEYILNFWQRQGVSDCKQVLEESFKRNDKQRLIRIIDELSLAKMELTQSGFVIAEASKRGWIDIVLYFIDNKKGDCSYEKNQALKSAITRRSRYLVILLLQQKSVIETLHNNDNEILVLAAQYFPTLVERLLKFTGVKTTLQDNKHAALRRLCEGRLFAISVTVLKFYFENAFKIDLETFLFCMSYIAKADVKEDGPVLEVLRSLLKNLVNKNEFNALLIDNHRVLKRTLTAREFSFAFEILHLYKENQFLVTDLNDVVGICTEIESYVDDINGRLSQNSNVDIFSQKIKTTLTACEAVIAPAQMKWFLKKREEILQKLPMSQVEDDKSQESETVNLGYDFEKACTLMPTKVNSLSFEDYSKRFEDSKFVELILSLSSDDKLNKVTQLLEKYPPVSLFDKKFLVNLLVSESIVREDEVLLGCVSNEDLGYLKYCTQVLPALAGHNNSSLLLLACWRGDLKIVEFLIAQPDVKNHREVCILALCFLSVIWGKNAISKIQVPTDILTDVENNLGNNHVDVKPCTYPASTETILRNVIENGVLYGFDRMVKFPEVRASINKLGEKMIALAHSHYQESLCQLLQDCVDEGFTDPKQREIVIIDSEETPLNYNTTQILSYLRIESGPSRPYASSSSAASSNTYSSNRYN